MVVIADIADIADIVIVAVAAAVVVVVVAVAVAAITNTVIYVSCIYNIIVILLRSAYNVSEPGLIGSR